jgi:hypothetical protein
VAGLVICKWRKALDAQRGNNPGSRRLIRAASAKGADAQRGLPLPADQVEQRRRNAIENNLAQYLKIGYHGPWWTAKDVALLGVLPDEEVARLTGRSRDAVRWKRARLGIPNPALFGRPPWTPEGDRLLRTLPGVEVARRTGRPLHTVYWRRAVLGLADGRAGFGRRRRSGP